MFKLEAEEEDFEESEEESDINESEIDINQGEETDRGQQPCLSFQEIIENPDFSTKLFPIPLSGNFPSKEAYLEDNYYLLREDFTQEIRVALQQLILNKPFSIHPVPQRIRELFFLYINVLVDHINFTEKGILIQLNSFPKLSHSKQISSKQVMPGSLLILTDENLSDFQFLQSQLVVTPNIKDIKSKRIQMVADMNVSNLNKDQIIQKIKNIYHLVSSGKAIMLQPKGYWRNYSFLLNSIQEMRKQKNDLPFQNIIISPLNYVVQSPDFIKDNTQYKLNLGDTSGDVLVNQKKWPEEIAGSLDISQIKSLQHLVSHQIPLIQGPPGTLSYLSFINKYLKLGTGKSFVGSTLIKVLLDNEKEWNESKSPILIVCKTNHAVDSFILNIEKYTQSIVRVGRRFKDPRIEKYSFFNKKKEYVESYDSFYTQSYGELKRKCEEARDKFFDVMDLSLDSDAIFQKLPNEERWFFTNIKKKAIGGIYSYFHHKVDSDQEEAIFYSWWAGKIKVTQKQLQKETINNSKEERKNALNNKNMRYEKKERYVYTYESVSLLLRKFRKKLFYRLVFQKIKEIGLWNEVKNKQSLRYQIKKWNDKQTLEESIDKLIEKEKKIQIQNEEEEENDENEQYDAFNQFNYDQEIQKKDYLINQGALMTCNIVEAQRIYNDIYHDKKNIFELTYQESQQLKSFFVELVQKSELENIFRKLNIYLKLLKVNQDEYDAEVSKVLNTNKVVCMTLNGALMNTGVIKKLQPSIVIVEEAGEVLESFLIPLLQPSLKQLVLIGDHKQLKPETNDFQNTKKYKYDVSLLERLINNNIQYSTLNIQRRMRPEFADYIRLIYKDYKDHESVKSFEYVHGVSSNIYLISHCALEDQNINSTSKTNKFEAYYAIKLAKYIKAQGQFDESQITILTMYLHQAHLIKDIARKDKLLKITVRTVDEYQGEENEIIILSLVRSNIESKLGFVNTSNRINVAFSRARKGFYCIGNFYMIKACKSAYLWQKIIQLAESRNQLVEELYLICSKHKKGKIINPSDFDNLKEKVCNVIEDYDIIKCGHFIKIKCHLVRSHKCVDIIREKCVNCNSSNNGKLLNKLCSLTSQSKCQNLIEKQLECGHVTKVKCSNINDALTCKEQIRYKCPNCNSNNQNKLLIRFCNSQIPLQPCQNIIEKQLICGHVAQVECHKFDDPIFCKELVIEKCSYCNSCDNSKLITRYCSGQQQTHNCKNKINITQSCDHSISIECSSVQQRSYLQINCQETVRCQIKSNIYQKKIKSKVCYELQQEEISLNNIQDTLPCGHVRQTSAQFQTCFQKVSFICPTCKGEDRLIKYCFEEKSNKTCTNLVFKLLPKCFHQKELPCNQTVKINEECNQKVTKMLICGHTISRACSDKSQCAFCLQYQKSKYYM